MDRWTKIVTRLGLGLAALLAGQNAGAEVFTIPVLPDNLTKEDASRFDFADVDFIQPARKDGETKAGQPAEPPSASKPAE